MKAARGDLTPTAVETIIMSPRTSLPLYHSVHRGRSNKYLPRITLRKVLVALFLLFGTVLISSLRSLLAPNYLKQATRIAKKLRLTKRLPYDPELAELNQRLDMLSVDEILLWAHDQFPPNTLVDVTSFGPSGLVILHKLQQLHLLQSTPVVTIDTLHLFPQTYDFIQELKATEMLHHANLYVYQPRGFATREEFDDEFGSELWKTNPDKYAYLSKVEPTLSALQDTHAAAWITGRRRSQGGERSNLTILEIDTSNTDSPEAPRYKLNPLSNWSYENVWDYIHKHNIPYNKLHDEGYKSIGDIMSTARVVENASERSGRFVGLTTTECGIHASRMKILKMKQQAEEEGRAFDGVADLAGGETCIQVQASNFDNVVLNGKTDLLVEFYSPMCGACQQFAPTFKEIAERLHPFQHLIQSARFDITEEDVPESGQKAGFDVAVTPSLFLVRRNPLRVVPYKGSLNADRVMEWVRNECDYVKL